MEIKRKLASVQVIADIQPIEGADAIEVALINAWKIVIKKGEYAVGQKVVYCEIDSFLPIAEPYEFLRKTSLKKMGDREGFRIKTIRLRGQISQGLLLPLPAGEYEIGDDVTEQLGIVKYEPPIPANLSGIMRGAFPSFIPKTDEERVQNLSNVYDSYKQYAFYITEKLDGGSATFYFHNGTFGACSRNLDLLETPDNTFWKVARQLDLERKLSELGNIALQGELIGEGIQGNPYKIHGQKVYFFNAFDIDNHAYYSLDGFLALCQKLEIEHVPLINDDYRLPDTIDELLLSAEGKSALHPQTEREGIVIRNLSRTVSFKAISNRFLLKND
jgi:RNA ligase (TIGR02306 family)